MSYFTELSIEGKTYQLKRYYLIISRDDDEKGRPSSDPTWDIFALIESITDSTITNWMLDPKKLVNGAITLYSLDGSKLKDIEFKKASCVILRDHFNIENAFLTSFIRIRGKDLKINTAELLQSWPGH